MDYLEKLKDELKKLVANKVTVTSEEANWIINIKGTPIEVPKISNTVVRKNNVTKR